jgi:PKHD-type hydroxylase
MLIEIPKLLTAAQVGEICAALEAAPWADGRAAAGYLSAKVKDNAQLPETDPLARRLSGLVLDALDKDQTFLSAALPLKVLPPLFNRYAGGQSYGAHVDGAVRPVPGGPHRVRTDISGTLFLSDPVDYDGGELMVEDAFGARSVKLAAGSLVLYPGTSVHRVAPVTRGRRLAAFFWVQSMVRDDGARTMLFELDRSIQDLARATPDHPALVRLAGVYHNMLRRWADL